MTDFLYIFRGGVDMKTLTPEQMQQLMGAWFAWIHDLRQRGAYQAGDPLDDAGRVVAGVGGKSVTDGPYAEGKEEVGGYVIVAAATIDQAAALAKSCPILANGGTVEVRPIVHMPDGP